MMHMTLYWGKELTLLFDSWKTESWLSYSFTLLFCFLLSLFHQRLEAQRFKLKSINKPPPPPSSSSGPSGSSINTPLILRKVGPIRCIRIASAALFGVISAIGYVIMLTIMSYNGGVFVVVVLGLSIGYFLFRSGDLLEDENVGLPVEDNACGCS